MTPPHYLRFARAVALCAPLAAAACGASQAPAPSPPPPVVTPAEPAPRTAPESPLEVNPAPAPVEAASPPLPPESRVPPGVASAESIPEGRAAQAAPNAGSGSRDGTACDRGTADLAARFEVCHCVVAARAPHGRWRCTPRIRPIEGPLPPPELPAA